MNTAQQRKTEETNPIKTVERFLEKPCRKMSGLHGMEIIYPKERAIHQLFEETVNIKKNSTAIVFHNSMISYIELNIRANKLAYVLRENGIGKNCFVGIYLKRSIEMFVAILGVLKSGAAYLPLDPMYPNNRINYMIDHSGVGIIIGEKERNGVGVTNGIKWIDIYDESIFDKYSYENLNNLNDGNDALYLIYTSGSTGNPKGIVVEHRNVNHLIHAMKKEIDIQGQESILCITTICFDIFVLESLLPLSIGLKIILADEAAQEDPDLLWKLLKKNDVDIIQSTPSRYKMLLNFDRNILKELKLEKVLVGGDVVDSGLAKDLKMTFKAPIFNVYGPTETTVWSTIKNITNESKVTIGKPIGNTTVYIFNDRIEETDDEEMGEICIGGDGVARGYYKDEKLTQEKFINKNNIGRIYKTGDLGKRLKTGDIEFHGRRDMQVKINGYRIELGEIENSIRLNPHIKDVVIFMSEMNSGNKAIIAHLIKKDATPDDKYESDDEIIEKLSNELKRILPSYMIPSVFEIVDKFPLTPNGKIDRNAIKNSFKKPSIEVELTPPGSMTEKILHSIWCEELGKGMQNIGIHENFFRIGGSSLAAISISTEIRKKLKKNCSARQIFENPTIASLSKKIENNEEYGSVKKVEIKEMNGSENIPLSQTNFMFWFVESMLKMPVGPVNQIYQIDGKFDIPKFEKAVNTICSSHESIWCTFSSIRPLVKMNRPGKITIHNDDISDIEASLKEKYMENLYKKEFYTPFTYNKGPLIRISIITIEKTKHTLLVSLPHMICDDGSLNAITMEIFKEYSNDVHAHSNGREAKKYSLKEMIRDQKEFMNSEKFEKGLQFYREKLKGFKFLSIDKSFLVSKLKRSNKKIIESISLSKEMMSQISEISIKTETTPQEVILSIVFASLRKFYEVNDILLYMPVDLSGIYPSPKMVNFFVGSIPVRIVINSNATYKKLLLTIKSYLMETFDHLLVLDSNIAGIGTDMIELKKTTFRIAKMILLQAMKLLLGKRHVNPKIIDYGVSCMLAEFEVKGNVKKQNPNRVYSSPFYFNVLPEFYKDTVLLKTDSIKVSYSHNFNVIVNPRAFEENNSSMEGRNKNIFLTKNEEGQATLYLCGGGLNAEAYSYLKKIMGQQLLQMLTNIDGTIIS